MFDSSELFIAKGCFKDEMRTANKLGAIFVVYRVVTVPLLSYTIEMMAEAIG